MSFLLLLALLLLGIVHADGKRAGLHPVLVLDQEGVLAGIGLGDCGDGDAGELAVLVRELVALVAQQLFLVLRPADLGHGVAPHVSSQVQGLKTGEEKKEVKKGSHNAAAVDDDDDDDDSTFPSWMATTSGNPPMTRARSKQNTKE